MAAERRTEELRARQVEVRQQLFARDVAQCLELVDHVGGVRRAACVPQTAAMTVMHAKRRAVELESHLPAGAAARRHAVTRGSHRRVEATRAPLRWILRVLRQPVVDLVTGGLRSRKQVHLRTDAKLALARTGRPG